MKKVITCCMLVLFLMTMGRVAFADTSTNEAHSGATALAQNNFAGSEAQVLAMQYLSASPGFAQLFNGKESTFVQQLNATLLQMPALSFDIVKDGNIDVDETNFVYAYGDVDKIAAELGVSKKENRSFLYATANFGETLPGRVVATFQGSAKAKKADKVNANTLRRKVEILASDERFWGYDMRLVSIPNTFAITFGVNAGSESLNVATAISKLAAFSVPQFLAGNANTATFAKGITVPIAVPGQTYFLVMLSPGDPNDSRTPKVNLREIYVEMAKTAIKQQAEIDAVKAAAMAKVKATQ